MNLQIYCKNTIYFSDSQGKWGIILENCSWKTWYAAKHGYTLLGMSKKERENLMIK